MTRTNDSNLQQLLQAVIDHDDLQQYYHVDELPQRKPLRIAKNPNLTCEPELKKFGVPVVYQDANELKSNEEPYLELMRWTVNPDLAHVAFEYAAEGVRGSAFFTRDDDQWRLDVLTLVETD